MYLYVCLAVGSTWADTMADMNIPANDAPVEQAPDVAPPIRTDDQILLINKWVPIGKSNCVLDALKSQRNPIFPIVVALLKNNNFFRAFTASSTMPAIYIQQFWDTMCFNSSTGLYSCQLDEQCDTVIDYVNTLGYPGTLRNVSAMSVNALYQPWRAVLSKTDGYDRPRHPEESSYCFAWKEEDRSSAYPKYQIHQIIIHHLRTKHNIHPRTGSPLYYSHDENVLNTLRFVGKDGREIFRMPIPDALLTDEIKGAPYYSKYQEHVAKYQLILDVKRDKAEEGGATESSKATKVTKLKAAKVSKPAGDPAPKKRKMVKETPDDPLPAKRSKAGLVGKRRKAKSLLRLIDEPIDEGVPVEEPTHDDEEADLQRALELKVQGKGKEKVVEEQVAHDLLTLQIPKKKSLAGQFIFQRRTPMPTEPTRHADSPSVDAELALSDSETESYEEVPVINTGDQDEGQAGPNPGEQDEGQAGSNPGDAAESQPQPSHVVHAGPNLENMDLEATDASTQQKPKQMDE
ncbi:hypothetical protein Tco_0359025 [Tanacetum coccineum]